MGGSSTPQNANAGNALSNLFLSNQATPQVSTPTIAAPQSPIGNVPMPAPTASPIAYTPEQTITQPPTAWSFGFGGGDFDNTRHPYAQGNFGAAGLGPGAYVQKTQTIPAQVNYQPSQSSLIAQAINKKYGGS